MRITGGDLSGRILKAPAGLKTRPTTDRVREAIFNILAHHEWNLGRDTLAEATVLDAFAGTGALAIEALSRGAKQAFLWDNDRQAVQTITANVTSLNLAGHCAIRQLDALKAFSAPQACNLIFLDPPYRQELVPRSLAVLHARGWIADQALIVAETAKNERLDLLETFKPVLTRIYGDTAVNFLMG